MKNLFLSILGILFLSNCTIGGDDEPQSEINLCNSTVIVNTEQFNNLVTDYFTISEAEIIDDCLSITYHASGCNPINWQEFLYTEETPSSQLSAEVALKVITNEACLAVFSKTITFNLKPLRKAISNSIQMEIRGFDTILTYNY